MEGIQGEDILGTKVNSRPACHLTPQGELFGRPTLCAPHSLSSNFRVCSSPTQSLFPRIQPQTAASAVVLERRFYPGIHGWLFPQMGDN